jgi:uncharacterized protein (TIGR04255 family)
MDTFPTLAKAPIREAVIAVTVSLRSPLGPEGRSRLKGSFRAVFPVAEELRGFEGMVQIVEGRVTQSVNDQGVSGLLLRSERGDEVLQVREDGFSFSKLRPYSSWDRVFASAQAAWRKYAEVADIDLATRLAVRYINQFPIPSPSALPSYLTAPPSLPGGLDNVRLRGALARLFFEEERTGITCRLTRATEETPEGMAVIIDIDAAATGTFEHTEAGFWETFTHLRTLKNKAFFGSLTPDALKDFD